MMHRANSRQQNTMLNALTGDPSHKNTDRQNRHYRPVRRSTTVILDCKCTTGMQCPFNHEKIIEKKVEKTNDWLSEVTSAVLEEICEYIGENLYGLSCANKRMNSLIDSSVVCNCMTITTDPFPGYEEYIDYYNRAFNLAIDPYKDLFLMEEIYNNNTYKNLVGLSASYSFAERQGYKLDSKHSRFLGLLISSSPILQYVSYSNMALNYVLCLHNRYLQELRIQNCILTEKCQFISPYIGLQRMVLIGTDIHDKLIFPFSLRKLVLKDTHYTIENLRNISNCLSLEYLDIGFTVFLWRNLYLLPRILQHLRLYIGTNSAHAVETVGGHINTRLLCVAYHIPDAKVARSIGNNKAVYYTRLVRGKKYEYIVYEICDTETRQAVEKTNAQILYYKYMYFNKMITLYM